MRNNGGKRGNNKKEELYLANKTTRLVPTLPVFLSPNVLDSLAKNLGIAPFTTPEEDLRPFRGKN